MEPTPDVDVVVTFLSHDVNTGAMAAAAIIEMIECLSIFIALSVMWVEKCGWAWSQTGVSTPANWRYALQMP